jgi:hypothetical protein
MKDIGRQLMNEIKKTCKKHIQFVVMLLKITGSIRDSVKVLGLAYLSRKKKLIFMKSKIDNAKNTTEIKKITAFFLNYCK